jgi:zinc transporter ZupT
MEVFLFLLLLPLTLIYAAIAILCGIYIYIGLHQLATGIKEMNSSKRNNGFIAMLLSLAVLLAATYAYFNWFWFF